MILSVLGAVYARPLLLFAGAQADMIDSYREAVMNGSESDPDVVIFGKEIGDDGERDRP